MAEGSVPMVQKRSSNVVLCGSAKCFGHGPQERGNGYSSREGTHGKNHFQCIVHGCDECFTYRDCPPCRQTVQGEPLRRTPLESSQCNPRREGHCAKHRSETESAARRHPCLMLRRKKLLLRSNLP